MAKRKQQTTLNDNGSNNEVPVTSAHSHKTPQQISKHSVAKKTGQVKESDNKSSSNYCRAKRLSIIQKILLTCIISIVAVLLYVIFKPQSEPLSDSAILTTDLTSSIEEQIPIAARPSDSTESVEARLPSPFSVVPKGRRVKVYGGQASTATEQSAAADQKAEIEILPTTLETGPAFVATTAEKALPTEARLPRVYGGQASSLQSAETFYQQKDFNKAYAVYNQLRQNLTASSRGPLESTVPEELLRDFLLLKMALCMKNVGDAEQADRLFRAVSKNRSSVIKITAYYHNSIDLMQKKQYLKARTKAYQTLALIDAIDWPSPSGKGSTVRRPRSVPHGAADNLNNDLSWRLVRDCQFIAAECLTQEILSLCDADKALPPDLWPHSLEFDPFVNLTEVQLLSLLSSGSKQLNKALLAPQIQSVAWASSPRILGQDGQATPASRSQTRDEGRVTSDVDHPSSIFHRHSTSSVEPSFALARWEVSCCGASVEELLERFAANANLDISWAYESAGQPSGDAPRQSTAETAVMRNEAVNLYMSAATAQQLVTTSAGCTGLLARFDNEGIIKICNPFHYTSLSEHKALLIEQAISLWQKYLLTFGDDESAPNAHFALGLLQAHQGQPIDAIAEYKLTANRYPRTSLAPFALLYSSKLKIDLRDYLGAREDLKQLIEQYPNSEPSDLACLHLADATMKAGLLQEAARLYRKVYYLGRSLESQRVSALGAGRCFYEEKDYENAAKWLTRYINTSDPPKAGKSQEFCLAYFHLGKANLALGKYQQAINTFQHALMGQILTKEYVEIVSALVEVYVQQRDFVGALKILENARYRQLSQTESIEISLLKASVLRSMGLVDKALALLGDVVQYLPNSWLKAKVSFEQAKCSIAKGDLQAARKRLAEVLVFVEPGPLAHEVRYELADVCFKLGDNAQAIFICSQLLARAKPGSTELAEVWTSSSLPSAGELEAATKQKALDLLAKAYTEEKNYEKAALALLSQWPGQNPARSNPPKSGTDQISLPAVHSGQAENAKTKSVSEKSNREDITSKGPIKQDAQHNEG